MEKVWEEDIEKTIRMVEPHELKAAILLVNRVFNKFVAVDYKEEGQATFREYLKYKEAEISGDLASGHKKLWGCFLGERLAGVIASRDVSHIALFFVERDFQGLGLGRDLFDFFLCALPQEREEITVNSSPYAVKIYEKLGFYATDVEKENNGIRYIPMRYEIKKPDIR